MDKASLKYFINTHLPASDTILSEIISCFEFNEFNKNDYLLKEGKVSNEYLFLEDGFMRSYTFDTEGEEVTTYFFAKNNVVFEVASFFLRIPSTENIQALTDCKGYTITYDKLNMLFHTIPEFRDFGRKMLVKEFVAFKQRTLALINQTAEQRYANLIATNPELFQFAQLKQIASYLGIIDTSLSRIRREFSKK